MIHARYHVRMIGLRVMSGHHLQLALVLVLLAWGARGVAGAPPAPDAVRQRLSEAFARSVPEGALAVVLVRHRGQTLLARSAGTYSGELCPGMLPHDETAITLHHRFDIASVAKMFTAAAILRLHMAGTLDVDDPVADHVADLIGLGGEARKITIRHLLTHTSGLSTNLSFQGVDLTSRDAMLQYVLTATLAHAPGEQFEYNNMGYSVLAAIVERASGESFERFVAREVFRPAGMVETTFLQPADPDWLFETPRVVAAHNQCIGSASFFAWTWGFRGSTGVVTTAGDLARWHEALNGDQVLNAAAKTLCFEPALAGYACGWHVGVDETGRNIQFHSGGVQGFRSMLTRYRDDDAVIITLCDERCNPVAVDAAMRSALFADGDAGPSIEGAMHLAGHADQLNEHGVLQFTDVSLLAQPGGDDRSRLEIRQADALVAVVDMKTGIATKLAHDLGVIHQGKRGGAVGKEAQSEVWLATMVYTPDDNGDVTLREPLHWQVMPRYSGMDAQGRRVVDERTTVVLVDEARGFWPIILRLDHPTAGELLAQLENLVP